MGRLHCPWCKQPLTKQLHNVIFFPQPIRLRLIDYGNLQSLLAKFTIHSVSALHKHGFPELKDNYAHMIVGPT